MDALLGIAITYLSTIPAIKTILIAVGSVLFGIPNFITALVALWHAVVGVVQALAAIPYLSKLQGLADMLKADEAVIESKSSIALNFINRVSALPLPKAESAPAPQAPSA